MSADRWHVPHYSAEEVKAVFRNPKTKLTEHVERETAYLEAGLHPEALRLYRYLFTVGLYVVHAKGKAHAPPWYVSYLLPIDALAFALERDPKTLRKYADQLQTLGLVERRRHMNFRNGLRCNGLLWGVKLSQEVTKPVKLLADDFKQIRRDLDFERIQRKTCYQRYKLRLPDTISRLKALSRGLSELLLWALPSDSSSLSLLLNRETPPKGVLHDLLSVPGVTHRGRRDAVKRAAYGLAEALGDLGSLDKYRQLTWAALKLWIYRKIDLFGVLHLTAQRAVVDAREGRATNPGGWFIALLKKNGDYQELMEMRAQALEQGLKVI